MGKYNFDEIVERKHTNSLKYDYAVQRGKPADILPLWVADMDFRTPPEVTEALIEKAKHGIFGYSEPLDDYYDALEGWFVSHFGWKPDRNAFVLSCGVVFAICNLIDVLTEPGDAILINQPVYYPFGESIVTNGRKLVNSSLILREGRYELDFSDLEQQIRENDVKVYLLCNPHNPVGRVWTGEELAKIAEICLKYDVFVISDEIHADFVYKPNHFTSYASLGGTALQKSAICTSASKTFNLAGLQNANIYIPDEGIRTSYVKEQNRKGYSQSNIMGIISCQTAYTYGEEWHRQLTDYLAGNLNYVRDFLKEKLPEIRLVEPEGTYLIWLDCSGLKMTDAELNERIVYKAKLWLDEGNIFGKEGLLFERMNIACPRQTLEKAFHQLYEAVKGE